MSDTPTPLTDAVSKKIGALAMQYKLGQIFASDFAVMAQAEMADLGYLETTLAAHREALREAERVLAELLPQWEEQDWKEAEQEPKGFACAEISYADAFAIRAVLARIQPLLQTTKGEEK